MAGRLTQTDKTADAAVLDPPRPRLSVGVTGHRATHPGFAEAAAAIEETLAGIFDLVASLVSEHVSAEAPTRTRLHTLLADGADQLAAHDAWRRGWEIVTPLPFGADLNCAINARVATETDAVAVLAARQPVDPEVAARAQAIRQLYEKATLFQLKDADATLQPLYLKALAADEPEARSAFEAAMSARVALAARIVLEQSDLILAIWDGVRNNAVGGTSHTVEAALAMGSAVVLIDPAAPHTWRILNAPEALADGTPSSTDSERRDRLRQIVREALAPKVAQRDQRAHGARRNDSSATLLQKSNWRAHSDSPWHAYRRIEALFGGDQRPFRNLRQRYEQPDAFAQGSGAPIMKALREAPSADPAFVDRIARFVLPRFALADGVSAYLSDKYRGGMTINFMLSAVAIIGGIAYLPLLDSEAKWGFALFELVLLSAILLITYLGQKQLWHGRWFETRRAAEYLRHAPILLALGAARAPWRWPRGAEALWPEWYARHALREVGLPQQQVTNAYLGHCLRELLDRHVVQQRDYHYAKAKRLTHVHHSLDKLSEALFQLAVVSVALFLAFQIGAWLGWIDEHQLKDSAKVFTFLGVALPTLGGAIAGMRYFGDFERFAAISQVTAQKLDAVHERIAILLRAGDERLDYASVANLAHAADEIVVSEIENWQAVFGGKQITVPV